MAGAVSVFSNMTITLEALGSLMARLKAEPDAPGWRLSRNGHDVFVEMGTEDLDVIPMATIAEVTDLLGEPPKSRVAIMWLAGEAEFEQRMAKAVGRAMSERWPVVFSDNAGEVEHMEPPRIAGQD